MLKTIIHEFICKFLKCQSHSYTIRLLAGDASVRKYYRVIFPNNSYIVMHYPATDYSLHRFIELNLLLHNNDISTVQILHQDIAHGLLMLTDLGDTTLFALVTQQQDYNYSYTKAIFNLVKLQKSCYKNFTLAKMSADFYSQQLDLFEHWYLNVHLQLSRDKLLQFKQLRADLLATLVPVLLQQPQVLVHFDYHSRNLMLCDKQVVTIDYQDAMLGPIGYDIASLLQDVYIDWPESQQSLWINYYSELLIAHGLWSQKQSIEITTAINFCALQRHLKNLGVFARLHHSYNKSAYLQHIPLLLQYINKILSLYPNLTFNCLQDFLDTTETITSH